MDKLHLYLILFIFTSLAGHIIDDSTLICGICKNVEKQLPTTIKIIEHIGSLFHDYRVLVFENNSKDNTKAIIFDWQHRNPKILAECQNISDDELKSYFINEDYLKSEFTSYARNQVLKRAMSSEYDTYKFVIWIDMDFTVFPNFDGIIEVFKSDQEWDAVLANGLNKDKTIFWDWLAFRDNIEPFGPELLGHHEWYKPKRNFILKDTDPWYPVYSAFGGCGIYKRSSIIGCKYAAIVTPELEEVAARIMNESNKHRNHALKMYLNSLLSIDKMYNLPSPKFGLKRFYNYKTEGFRLNRKDITWRMNSFTYQYPATCDHVAYHASMICNGHDKLFINPRMKFFYGQA